MALTARQNFGLQAGLVFRLKKSKERVTFLLCTNMDGSQKMPVFALGRFAQPRSFRGVKTIPVEYSANASSWMTSELFKTWLMQFDRRMKAEKRSVLLTLDNCTAHEKFQPQLTGTELLFLLPNSTSKTQPLDQGVVHRMLRYTTEMHTSCNWLHILMLASQGRTILSTFCRP